jgi:hypothetical protein
MAKGMRRIVADEATWRLDVLSFVNFAFSASPREKSELLDWSDKHDFAKPEPMTQSITLSFTKVPILRAIMSPGQDLSWRRC